MATAATQTAPYPVEFKKGNLDAVILNGTMPADASGGLTWDLGWAAVYHVSPIAKSDTADADVGPFNWAYASGVLTIKGANAAAANDAPVTVEVTGCR